MTEETLMDAAHAPLRTTYSPIAGIVSSESSQEPLSQALFSAEAAATPEFTPLETVHTEN